jgi:signal transduction histidine kinase
MTSVVAPEDDGAACAVYRARMTSADRLLARLRGLDQRAVDALLAAVLTAWFLAELTTRDPHGTDRAVTAAAGAVVLVSMVWRTPRIAVVCVLFAVVSVAQEALGGGWMRNLDVSFAVVLSLLYTVGRRTEGRRMAVLGLLLYLGVTLALGQQEDTAPGEEVVWGIAVSMPPLLAGRAMRIRRRMQDELRTAQLELAAAHEDRALRAVDDERARIALELQAAIANDVSAIVVQAEAVPRVLRIGERDTAALALREIEETGRSALAEMRGLLGVLRHDGEGPALAPQPGVADLDALARPRIGDAPEVTVAVEGDPVDVRAGVELAVFWIAERGVEGAAAAGARAVRLLARYERGRIALRLTDDRAAHADEADAALVAAMRARADLYAGHVRVTRRDDARVVDVVLPLRRPVPVPS